jgi:Ulp1 family protease
MCYRSNHAAIFDKLQIMATAAGHPHQLQRFTVEVPDQRKTNDCGVLACLFQLYMAQTMSA